MAARAEVRLVGIKACVFDAYGTLFDVHSAVGKHSARLADKAGAVSILWRQKQLEYTWLRSLMRDHADFWQVTSDGLSYALEAHGLGDPSLHHDLHHDLLHDLLHAYLELDAYPEVPDMLEALGERGLKRGILSNGEPRMLASAVSNAGLDGRFEAVISVEDIKIFKPDPGVYQIACERFGVEPSQICFMSSNAWDVAGAAHFGFQVIWINRFNQPKERLSGVPRAVLSDLSALPSMIKSTFS